MTHSVFRQLPIRSLLDGNTLEVLGTVWGWVNYNPDSSPKEKQFVVAADGLLCRCPFWVRDVIATNPNAWPATLEEYGHRYASCATRYIVACVLNERIEFSPREDKRQYILPERPFFGNYVVGRGSGTTFDEDIQSASTGFFIRKPSGTAIRTARLLSQNRSLRR